MEPTVQEPTVQDAMPQGSAIRDEARPVESDRIESARRALQSLVAVTAEERAELTHGLFTDDFVIEIPARGGCQVYSSLERGEFRSGTVEILDAIESGCRVIAHVRFEAERCRSVEGATVTQECSADGIVTFEFRGDRIARSWSMLRWR